MHKVLDGEEEYGDARPAKNCGDRCILLRASRSNSLIIIPAITTSPIDAASHKCHVFILC